MNSCCNSTVANKQCTINSGILSNNSSSSNESVARTSSNNNRSCHPRNSNEQDHYQHQIAPRYRLLPESLIVITSNIGFIISIRVVVVFKSPKILLQRRLAILAVVRTAACNEEDSFRMW